MTARSPRFPLFDSLRAIAALSVVLFHVAFVLEGFTDDTWGRYATQLNIGVPIFFLISGFLLYRPFAKARFEGSRAPQLGPYAIRRAFRILPAYWVAVAVIAWWVDLPAVFNHWYYHFTLLQVYNEFDLLGGVGHTWTLAVEITFYVLLPVWAFSMRRLPARSTRQFVAGEALALGAMFAAGLWWNLTQVEQVGDLVLFSPEVATLPRFLDHFALGMGLAVASVVLAGRARQPLPVRIVERASWLPWVVAAGCFVVLANLGSSYVSADVEPIRHELRGLIGLCVLLPAVFGEASGGAVRRLLASRPLLWVGMVSYSLYLWHPAIAQKIVYTELDENVGWVLPAVLIVIASVAAAAVSFYVIERPMLRAGRSLARRAARGEPPEGEAAGAAAGFGAPADDAPADIPAPSGR